MIFRMAMSIFLTITPMRTILIFLAKHLLFQYINRTTSEMGSRQLAQYLQFPAEPKMILERQNAVKELSNKTIWIQDLQAKGKEKKITFSTKNRLQNWIKEPPVFSKFKPWKWLRYFLPAIIFSIVMLYIFDVVGNHQFFIFRYYFCHDCLSD